MRYTDYTNQFASVRIAIGDEQLATSHNFSLKAGEKVKIFVEVRLEPEQLSQGEQEFGWVYFNPNVDGNVDIVEKGKKGDELHVAWHVSALAAADAEVFPNVLDLTSGARRPGGRRSRGGAALRPTCSCSGPRTRPRPGGRGTSSRSAPAPSPAQSIEGTAGGPAAGDGSALRSNLGAIHDPGRRADGADRVRGGGRRTSTTRPRRPRSTSWSTSGPTACTRTRCWPPTC